MSRLFSLVLLLSCGKRDSLPRNDIPPPPGTPGNVMVVLLDDIGIERLATYGADDPIPTPTLDGLAAQGVRFENAYAAPLCSPSRAQLLTGRHARRTGIGNIVSYAQPESQLALEAITIPEALAMLAPERTWSSAVVGKWHLAGEDLPDKDVHPRLQGFGSFDGILANPQGKSGSSYTDWRHVDNEGRAVRDREYLTTSTTNAAIDALGTMQEPWFLYVAFNAAHKPLHVPPPKLAKTRGTSTEDRFAAVVEAMDQELGRLLDAMPAAQRARTTLLVIGDNGSYPEALPANVGANDRRLKGTVYEGGTRVPLFVVGPDVRDPGSSRDALVQITDVFPTVLDLAGTPIGETLPTPAGERAIDGRSLLPLVRGEPGGHRYVYTEAFLPNGGGPHKQDYRSVRNDTHLLVRHKKRDRLYRLDAPHRWESTTDLMKDGSPTDLVDVQAMVELIAEMERLESELVHEGF